MDEASFQSEAKERCSCPHLILSSVPHKQTSEMLIKTVFDIQTKQIGYAVCNAEHRCGFVTYSITNAIKAAQCKDFNQVQQLINA